MSGSGGLSCAFEGVPWPGLVVCIWMGQTEGGEGLCLKPTCRIGINEAGVGEGFRGQAHNMVSRGQRGSRSGT